MWMQTRSLSRVLRHELWGGVSQGRSSRMTYDVLTGRCRRAVGLGERWVGTMTGWGLADRSHHQLSLIVSNQRSMWPRGRELVSNFLILQWRWWGLCPRFHKVLMRRRRRRHLLIKWGRPMADCRKSVHHVWRQALARVKLLVVGMLW